RTPGKQLRPGPQFLIRLASPASYEEVQNSRPQVHTTQATAEAAGCAGSRCHVVRLGDTIGSIARTYGVHEKSILEANNIPGPRSLKVGQTIAIPEAASGQAAAPATARETPVSPASKAGPAIAAASPAVSEPKAQATDAPS